MEKTFHKENFLKIDEEKRDRIFQTAISEFASQGYNATNINIIAKKAGISIGSLYSYFGSKEDLFLAMAEKGVQILNRAVEEMLSVDGTLEETIARLLWLTVRYTKEHPDLTKIYLNLSTEELTPLSERLAQKMEISFKNYYHTMLEKARDRGEIPEDSDIDLCAFFIDNQVMMLQYSLSTNYYARRLEEYLGERELEDLIRGMLSHLIASVCHRETKAT